MAQAAVSKGGEMRPINETATDIRNEDEVMRHVCNYFTSLIGGKTECIQWKTKKDNLAPLDRIIMRTDTLGMLAVEVKCRSCKSSDYRTYMISEEKYKKLVGLEISAALVVRWTDCIGLLAVDDYPHPGMYRETGGRKDRGQDGDIEFVLHIPIEHFRVIG